VIGQAGRLLSFEGLDGCGKGTQLDRVEAWLRERGHLVERFREPGGSAVSEAIRAILLDPAHEALAGETELLLFTAARVQLLKERVLPALAQGRVVLLDRFADSTTAYQGHGRRLPLGMVEALNQLVRSLAWPERTFWLDLDPAVALDFFRRVREGYAELAAAEPLRIVRVDAAGTPEVVFARLEPELARLFAGRKDAS